MGKPWSNHVQTTWFNHVETMIKLHGQTMVACDWIWFPMADHGLPWFHIANHGFYTSPFKNVICMYKLLYKLYTIYIMSLPICHNPRQSWKATKALLKIVQLLPLSHFLYQRWMAAYCPTSSSSSYNSFIFFLYFFLMSYSVSDSPSIEKAVK